MGFDSPYEKTVLVTCIRPWAKQVRTLVLLQRWAGRAWARKELKAEKNGAG